MCDEVSGRIAEADTETERQLSRAERRRGRIQQMQTIAAHASRIEAAGGKPSHDEVASMVAEFIARGGMVTVCPSAEATLDDAEDPDKET